MLVNKVLVLIVAMVMSIVAYANDNLIVELLQEEEQFAEVTCQSIAQDQEWKNLLSNYPRLQQVYQRYPKGYNKDAGFTLASTTAYDIARTSQRHFSDASYQKVKGQKDWEMAFEEKLMTVRVLRVLKKCGLSLKNQNLILLLPLFDLKTGSKDEMTKLQQVMETTSCLKAYDAALITNFRAVQKGGSVDKMIFDLQGTCFKEADDLYNKVVFPYHVMVERKPTDYYSKYQTVKFEKTVAMTLEEVNAKHGTAVPVMAAQAKEQQEKRARLVKISSGSVSVAKTCGEVAEGLIAKDNFSAVFSGYPISKDAQAVYNRPTQKLYSTIGNIISVKSNEIVTYDRNQISGVGYAYKLKIGKNAVWFKDDVTIGKNVYFVGRYVDNDVTTITQGQTSFDVSTRVIDVMCVTSM